VNVRMYINTKLIQTYETSKSVVDNEPDDREREHAR